jgi:glycerophosphoryl diester phosphodiesterase
MFSVVNAPTPRIIAHRGASADAPENTLAAFRLAWEQGADGIEGDYHLTADGRIACIHNEDTGAVSGVRRVVKETRYDDLREIEVLWKGQPVRGERIPLLEEVLAIIPDGKHAFLELKTGPEIVEPLADVLRSATIATDQIVLMSFDAELVRVCKERMPQFKCLWLTEFKQQVGGRWKPMVDDVIDTIRLDRADGLGCENRTAFVDEDFFKRLRAAGIDEVHVWTVDDADDARFYQRLGATSLITNRPAALRRELSGGSGES